MPKILAFSSSRSFVHNFYETRLSLKILDDEVPYKLSYFDLSHFKIWHSFDVMVVTMTTAYSI